jgi:four helix bundle protein
MDASKKENRCSTFEDLEIYQVAREFRKAMYRIARRLPDSEKFALANQIRRAAVSLTNKPEEFYGHRFRARNVANL